MLAKRNTALSFVLAVWASGALQAGTYYVAKRGNDAWRGSTKEQPFLTIERGVQALKPGDTLIVGPGVYREEVLIEKSGTREKAIAIRAQYPGRAELVGSVRITNWSPVRGRRQTFRARLDRPTYLVYEKDTDTEYLEVANLATVERTAGAFLYEPDEKTLYVHPSDDMGMQHHVMDACVLDYGLASLTTKPGHKHSPRRVGLVIDGFVLRDYNMNGIFIHNADYCTIRNCTVHHCRRGIFTYSAFRSRITGCEVFSCADRFNREVGNIGMMGYSFECTQDSNIVHHTRQHGIRFYGGFYGCAMRDNLAYDCRVGLHVKGKRYDHTTAMRYARFSDGGKPNLRPDSAMVFEGNIVHRAVSAGMLPHYCVFRRNTGVKVSSSRAVEKRSNIELSVEQVSEARFADPAWHDMRLQSDSPHRRSGQKGETGGAFPYRDEVFFVSPTGDDTKAGTSIGAAWQTLRHASSRLRAGQTLYILPSAYTEPIQIKSLHATDGPTIVRAHGKGAVVLDGKGKNASAIEIVDCRNVLIQGLRIRNTARQGVLIRNSSGVRFSESEILGNLGDGVRIEGASADARIVSNTIVFNRGRGASVDREAIQSWIVGNIVRGNRVQLDFPSGLPQSVHSDSNDLGDGTVGSVSGKTATTLDLWRMLTGLDARSVDVDPSFVDADARDLRLTATSLCRGRGYLNRHIGSGRIAPTSDEDMSFTDVRVIATSATTADLAWSVKGGLATMIVAYGTDPTKLDSIIVRDTGHYYGRHHLTTLKGLKPGTRYFFRVGSRRVLDGEAPYHSYRYAWPERTPQGQREYYKTLRKQDTFDSHVVSFTTRTRDVVSPQVYHVSAAGDDGAAGTEKARLRTIGRACQMAWPGDRVVVHEGTYHECIRPLRSGLPGHPIVFEAAHGERVEINGKREVIPFGVDLLDRHHVVVRGFFFFGQTEVGPNRSGFGHIRAVGASDILVERCVFDGRMNYINPVFAYRSKDVTIHNNIFVSHHSAMIVHDNVGRVAITRNTFLGCTIHKIYAPRNERVVIRNNLFGENLFPKKKRQYKVVLMSNRHVDMDYNCFYFDPKNDERRVVDIGFSGIDLAAVTALPEQQAKAPKPQRFGVRGNLDLWRKALGRGRHSFIADPKWQHPDTIAKLRKRPRGWPSRFFNYEPFARGDLGLADDTPCRGAGENGTDIGADHSY